MNNGVLCIIYANFNTLLKHLQNSLEERYITVIMIQLSIRLYLMHGITHVHQIDGTLSHWRRRRRSRRRLWGWSFFRRCWRCAWSWGIMEMRITQLIIRNCCREIGTKLSIPILINLIDNRHNRINAYHSRIIVNTFSKYNEYNRWDNDAMSIR